MAPCPYCPFVAGMSIGLAVPSEGSPEASNGTRPKKNYISRPLVALNMPLARALLHPVLDPLDVDRAPKGEAPTDSVYYLQHRSQAPRVAQSELC